MPELIWHWKERVREWRWVEVGFNWSVLYEQLIIDSLIMTLITSIYLHLIWIKGLEFKLMEESVWWMLCDFLMRRKLMQLDPYESWLGLWNKQAFIVVMIERFYISIFMCLKVHFLAFEISYICFYILSRRLSF